MNKEINEKEKELIINFGALEYKAKKMAKILGWGTNEVKELLKDTQTEFSKYYLIGKSRSEYIIDMKLLEQAQHGDIKSLEKLEQRKRRK